MPKKQNVVVLDEAERQALEQILKTGQQPARIMRRAQALLWSEQGKTDEEIAELQDITPLTVAKTRQRWMEKKSLQDQPRPGRERKLDGKQEAFLVALACSEAPGERESWTMQLLADRLVELKVIEEPISDETVRRRLKKTTSSPGAKNNGV